jgi:hypothetical protein
MKIIGPAEHDVDKLIEIAALILFGGVLQTVRVWEEGSSECVWQCLILAPSTGNELTVPNIGRWFL